MIAEEVWSASRANTFGKAFLTACLRDGGGPVARWGVPANVGLEALGDLRSGPEGALGLVASLGGGARGAPASYTPTSCSVGKFSKTLCGHCVLCDICVTLASNHV